MDHRKLNNFVNSLSFEDAAMVASKLMEKLAPGLEYHGEAEKAKKYLHIARVVRGQAEIFKAWKEQGTHGRTTLTTSEAQTLAKSFNPQPITHAPKPNGFVSMYSVPAPTSGQKGAFKPKGWVA